MNAIWTLYRVVVVLFALGDVLAFAALSVSAISLWQERRR
jgi:hypothetical protein